MSLLGRSVVFGLAFAAALVAIAFGLRRVREAPAPAARGLGSAIRRAFWSAAALLLGTSAAGCQATCYEMSPADMTSDGEAEEDGGDADAEDAASTETAGDGAAEATEGVDAADEDAADVGDTAADAPVDGVEPDAMCYEPGEFDAGAETSAPDAGKQASTAEARRARRTLARAEAVAALWRDPQTHPAVREALRRDLDRLARAARKARRFLAGTG